MSRTFSHVLKLQPRKPIIKCKTYGCFSTTENTAENTVIKSLWIDTAIQIFPSGAPSKIRMPLCSKPLPYKPFHGLKDSLHMSRQLLRRILKLSLAKKFSADIPCLDRVMGIAWGYIEGAPVSRDHPSLLGKAKAGSGDFMIIPGPRLRRSFSMQTTILGEVQ